MIQKTSSYREIPGGRHRGVRAMQSTRCFTSKSVIPCATINRTKITAHTPIHTVRNQHTKIQHILNRGTYRSYYIHRDGPPFEALVHNVA